MNDQVDSAERRTASGDAGASVLVVDDSRAIRSILRRALEGYGYTVTEAGNGVEALAACREQPPDLMLLDIDMPVMDGLTAMREIKADPSLESLPVLFLTARTGGQDVAEGLGLGAQDYLRKPCEPAELFARVSTALRLKAQEDALRAQTQVLGDLSATDPLTGVGNRRMLQFRTAELTAARGLEMPVGVLLCDLDHFKRVNDTHGHPVGDTVLRIAAARMQHSIPDDAFLIRWGGEEFLIICPLRAGGELVAIAEQVRGAIAGSPFTVGLDEPLAITVSIGCASGVIAALESVTGRADDALYVAKESGRNRVWLDGAAAG